MQKERNSKRKMGIWLDCDPGLDDTLAIIYAAHHPEIRIVGVSTSPGNTTLANTTRNALDVLYNIGRKDIQVYSGSFSQIQGEVKTAEEVHGENGLGGVKVKQSPNQAYKTDSFALIYNKIRQQEEPIIWVNTGSLTNLCLLLMTFPDVRGKLSRIVMMGGAIGRGNITPAAEFNIHCDPAAFERVLQLKGDIELVMVPLEATHQFPANEHVYTTIKTYTDHPFGQALYTMALHYQQFYKDQHNIKYPPYHDPVTIHYLLYPQDFQTKAANITVDCGKKSWGRTNCDFYLSEEEREKSRTLVVTDLKGELGKFWDEILEGIKQVFSEEVQARIE